MRPAPALTSRALPQIFTLLGTLSLPVAAHAAPGGGGAEKRLNDALSGEPSESLKLVWTRGAASALAYDKLRIEAGRAALERCDGACQPVGAPMVLSAGEKSQLVSRLRGAGLFGLRDSDEGSADRQLELTVSGSPVGAWKLPRAEWPTPPDGYGLADLLDDLGKRIERSAQQRPPLPIPTTIAELRDDRLQLRVQPRNRPGGLLVIEKGRLRVTPEEGSLARQPRPRPFERPLLPDEEERLLADLKAAQLDALDAAVPKRAQPAVGDSDGRLATLHLLPSDDGTRSRALPRGYERYVADLERSTAAPLVKQLLTWLVSDLAEGRAADKPAPSDRAASPRPTAKRP